MRWPLRYQILFPFAGVMLLVVVGVSLLDAYLAARRTQRRIEQQLHEVAQTLLEGNFPLTDAVLKQTRGLSGAEFVLSDQQGKLLATSLDEPPHEDLPAGRLAPTFQLGDVVSLGEQQYLHTLIAVRPRGAQRQAMLLHIFYPRQDLRDARWQAAYPPLVVGSVLLVLVVMLAIAIARRLTRPILELKFQLSRLVQGDFQPLGLPQRNDELRDLIGSVNSLGDQLEELRRVIKRSERLTLLGQLSAGLAHQLRNSVTGARIAVQLHERNCRADQESLAVALRQLTMTESHLKRFLTMGQPSAPRLLQCDLRQVIADVMTLVSPSARHRGVTLECTAADDRPCDMVADADQLNQLLMNLVVNAMEAAGSGGWVRIELDTTRSSTIALRVLDSGPGPSSEMLERLFEPFATGKPEGIGLGLAVARRVAEAHGGTIRYIRLGGDMHEGATCFEVLLPVDGRPKPGQQAQLEPAQLEPAQSEPAQFAQVVADPS